MCSPHGPGADMESGKLPEVTRNGIAKRSKRRILPLFRVVDHARGCCICDHLESLQCRVELIEYKWCSSSRGSEEVETASTLGMSSLSGNGQVRSSQPQNWTFWPENWKFADSCQLYDSTNGWIPVQVAENITNWSSTGISMIWCAGSEPEVRF